MTTTDPSPRDGRKRGRTVVDDPPQFDDPEKRRRIHRAKKELGRVVRALPEDVRFDLMAYSDEVNPWQGSMVVATAKNKKEAVEFVEDIEAEGLTATDDALEEAFSDLEVDTIYLITDGAPTHQGTRKRGKLPPDSRKIIEEIHRRTRHLNFLRDVRIFCLGFRSAEEGFLKKLARDNRGRYVRIR